METSLKLITALTINGQENIKTREVFDLNNISVAAFQAETVRSFKRICKAVNGMSAEEVKPYGLLVEVILVTGPSVRREYQIEVRHQTKVSSLYAIGNDPTWATPAAFPMAYDPGNKILIATWANKVEEVAASEEVSAASDPGEEVKTPMDKQDMLNVVIAAKRGELLNTMEVEEAYAIVLQEIAALQVAPVTPEVPVTTDIVVLQSPQIEKEEVIPVIKKEEVTPAAPVVATEPMISQAQLLEILAKQEEAILTRVGLALEAIQAVPVQQPVAQPKVEAAAPIVQPAVQKDLASILDRMNKREKFRMTTAATIEVSTAATANGIRSVTNMTANLVLFLGHNTADVIQKSGQWTANKVRPTEIREEIGRMMRTVRA